LTEIRKKTTYTSHSDCASYRCCHCYW